MADGLPPDRVAFAELQAKNRRAAWRLGTVCALVVGGGGALAALGFVVNLALILFTLVFVPSVAFLGLGLLASLLPATAALREPLWEAGLFALRGLDLLVGAWSGVGPGVPWALALGLPLASWLAVRSVWLAAGVGETLLAMGAREPAPGDLEERQLVNVVEEMAIAAGLPPPRVRLLDAAVANAAAVGRGPAECYVVVGRRLLDEFDRDETQGVLGHLIGSIGNGDLRGAAQIHGMLYVLELLIVVVLAPFARLPRRVAGQWLLFPLSAPFSDPVRRAERARALIRALESHRRILRTQGDSPGERVGSDYLGWVGQVLTLVCPPLLALIALAQAATGFLLLFASAPVALLWRSRRYLADATAVELTRNPSGLYRALVRLAASGAAIPGGRAVSHLFVVGPEAVGGGERGTLSEREGLLMGMHPPLARRLARLVRMGAIPPGATAPAS